MDALGFLFAIFVIFTFGAVFGFLFRGYTDQFSSFDEFFKDFAGLTYPQKKEEQK